MGQCNFCTMRDIKRRAKKMGMKVTTNACTRHSLGGVDVYRHPKDEKPDTSLLPDDNPYFVAWFMRLPDKCACDDD